MLYTFIVTDNIIQDTDRDIEYLERFISENKELDELESIVNEFNIFTSLKIQFLEIRHSNFLSWLMDPSETHGLGDYFLKILLKRFIKSARDNGFDKLSIIDIDVRDLGHVAVRREWNNIDITIVDDVNNFVCVVENKIRSKDHGDQLQRYYKTISNQYPDYIKIFVYLSIDGETPESDEDNNWLPISYKEIVDLIVYMLESKKTSLGNDIIIFINHYLDMLRRYIVKESRAEELCQLIYKNHKNAIDLIIEHKPDRQEDISKLIQDIIKSHNDFILDASNKRYIRFTTKNLDFIPKLGKGWKMEIKRILLFEIQNLEPGIVLKLIIGPGEETIRQKIYKLAQGNKSVFKAVPTNMSPKYARIYSKNLIKADDYENMEDEELRTFVDDKINEWKKKDLLKIEKEISNLKGQ